MPTNPNRGMFKRPHHTKTRQLLIERMLLNLEHLKKEEIFDYHVQSLVPEAWDTLEQDVDVEEKKIKLTVYLDSSVAQFYRAMGKGFHGRINRILATFAQMRMAQVKKLNEMLDEELAKIDEMREEY